MKIAARKFYRKYQSTDKSKAGTETKFMDKKQTIADKVLHSDYKYRPFRCSFENNKICEGEIYVFIYQRVQYYISTSLFKVSDLIKLFEMSELNSCLYEL